MQPIDFSTCSLDGAIKQALAGGEPKTLEQIQSVVEFVITPERAIREYMRLRKGKHIPDSAAMETAVHRGRRSLIQIRLDWRAKAPTGKQGFVSALYIDGVKHWVLRNTSNKSQEG